MIPFFIILNNEIYCGDSILPTDFLPFGVVPTAIGNRHFINAAACFADFGSKLRFKSKTILAPDRVIFESQIQTRDARDKAQADVPEVYDPPNAALAREQVRWASRVMDYVDLIRRDKVATFDQKLASVQAIPGLTLIPQTIGATLSLDDNTFHRVISETLYVLELTMRDTIRPGDLSAESTKIPTRISIALSADQADLVSQWCRAFIVPNSFLNQAQTDEQRAQARDQVEPIYRTLEKGQAIVREGEVVTPAILEALQAAGFLRAQLSIADYLGPVFTCGAP